MNKRERKNVTEYLEAEKEAEDGPLLKNIGRRQLPKTNTTRMGAVVVAQLVEQPFRGPRLEFTQSIYLL